MAPRLIYGTAWKKDRTADLVLSAIRAGFRAIDTACQPRHYREDLVGLGIRRAIDAGVVTREDLWIQTKFTPATGQDRTTVPYDPTAPFEAQVRDSFAVSLKNLNVSYIDSLVLHSPLESLADTMRVWSSMEQFVVDGKVGQIGVSNLYDLASLQYIWEHATVRPAVVQNRFVADLSYCTDIRQFCSVNNIAFQSFWTLTGNPGLVHSRHFSEAAQRAASMGLIPRDLTPEQFFLKVIMDIGITPLSGTTSELHMAHDVSLLGLPSLPPEMVATLRKYVDVVQQPIHQQRRT